MRIYLGNMEFPAAPERLEVLSQGGWETAELFDLGEVSRYRPPKLRRFRFGGIFPGEDYGFVTAAALGSPKSYVQAMEQMMASREPSRLVVSGGVRPFSALVTVEGFDWRMQAGEDGDIYYELELREYRESGTAAVVSSGAGSAAQKAAAEKNPAAPAVYVVKKGDTLWAIARRFLGDGRRYREIAAANSVRNPNLIFPGQKLRIP